MTAFYFMTQQERINWCLDWIKKIQQENSTLSSNRTDALKFYQGDPDIVKVIEGRTKVTTSDLMDTIEWAKPALLEIFAGNDEVVSLRPASEEDVSAVKKQDLLVNYQMRIKNKWYLVMHDWISDALLMKTGGVKYQWFQDVKIIEKTYEGLNELEYQAKISESDVEILSHEEVLLQEAVIDALTGIMVSPAIIEHNLTVRYRIEDEYPLIEAVPPEELGFPITTRDIEDADFVYHCSRMPKWKFIKKYGKDKLDECEYIQESYEKDNVRQQRFKDLGGVYFFYDGLKKEYIVYECYFYDDDGTPRIVTLCGDISLKDDKNPYEKPPFHVITPIKMAHRVCGFSFYDLLKEIQKLRTELLRQIIDNLYQANFRRYFGDPDRLNMDDFLNLNVTNALIRTRGDPSTVVMSESKAPLPAETFTFWEMLNVEKDYHSGIPRTWQGVTPRMAHRTFRGQAQQVQLASQRVQAIARLIAEMGIAPLVNDIVNLNIKFLKKKTSIRYLNEWIEISPDNIVGKYDIAINVGLGTASKENTVIQMQQLLGLYAQIYKAGIPIITAQNAYNAIKEMVNAMGFKNTSDFVTDPQLYETVKTLIMAIQPYAQQDPQLMAVVQRIMAIAGVLPEQSQISAGTFEGQETPAQAIQPGQPSSAILRASSGGFYS